METWEPRSFVLKQLNWIFDISAAALLTFYNLVGCKDWALACSKKRPLVTMLFGTSFLYFVSLTSLASALSQVWPFLCIGEKVFFDFKSRLFISVGLWLAAKWGIWWRKCFRKKKTCFLDPTVPYFFIFFMETNQHRNIFLVGFSWWKLVGWIPRFLARKMHSCMYLCTGDGAEKNRMAIVKHLRRVRISFFISSSK